MQANRKLRTRLLVQNGLFVVLLFAALALGAWLAREYRTVWDWTGNARNTLSQPSLDLLKQIDGPVTVTSFLNMQDPQAGDLKRTIEQFFGRYQRAKPDFTLTFVDPRVEPKLAQAAGVRVNGEMVVDYQNRSEHLTDLSESSFANSLMRLKRAKERLVMGLDGHGERAIGGGANHDLGEFGRQLQAKGFKISTLNLTLAPDVPANASVLVIASPQVDLLPGEVAKVKTYLQRGGNLLWLVEQGSLRGLQPIAEQLGLVLGPGTIYDPDAANLKAPPSTGIGVRYPRHPITEGFRLNTLFPQARAIGGIEGGDWKMAPLVDVAGRGWVETGKAGTVPVFDKGRDVQGPVNVAAAFERQYEDRTQRVVVVGGGDVLSNAFLGNGGNLDFGVNVINWLSGDDNLITIQPQPATDLTLDFTAPLLYAIAFGFLVVLPLGFAITGGVIWWRRRRR
jgi:ABC-type uncharacterized transport system involved in gliding motility auxiliary subunit